MLQQDNLKYFWTFISLELCMELLCRQTMLTLVIAPREKSLCLLYCVDFYFYYSVKDFDHFPIQ